MPNLEVLGLFAVAAFLLLITPGPAVTYIVTRSISQGRAAGLVSSLGIGVGGLVHVMAATLGLSAVVASSAVAFASVKYAGAAYLVWLGVQRLRDAGPETEHVVRREPVGRIFWEGVLVNVLNPKTALFFLAFLPQFITPRGPVAPQVLFLGTFFVAMAIVTDSTWALVAGTAAGCLKGRAGLSRSGRYVAGTTYIGLGLVAAFAGPRKH